MLGLEEHLIDFIAFELDFPVFSFSQYIVHLFIARVEEGSCDAEIAENGLLLRHDTYLRVAVDDEVGVEDHAAEGVSAGAGFISVQHVGFVVVEGDQTGGFVQHLVLDVGAGVVACDVDVVYGFDDAEKTAEFVDVLVEVGVVEGVIAEDEGGVAEGFLHAKFEVLH